MSFKYLVYRPPPGRGQAITSLYNPTTGLPDPKPHHGTALPFSKRVNSYRRHFAVIKSYPQGGMVNVKVESHITFHIGPCPTLFHPVFIKFYGFCAVYPTDFTFQLLVVEYSFTMSNISYHSVLLGMLNSLVQFLSCITFKPLPKSKFTLHMCVFFFFYV